jgi:DNA-binding LacI/PurR family transcriptional regulator
MVKRKDVALLAGVSEAVVSYVLHNKPYVKEDTRRKVLDAIEKLGYRPNLLARGLKSLRTQQIAVLVSSLGNPFEAGILLNIERVAQELGYAVFFLSYKEQTEDKLIEQLYGRIDGLLLLGQSLRTETIEHFNRINIPIASLLTPAVIHESVQALDVDWEQEMRRIVNHLTGQGHRSVGMMVNQDAQHYHRVRADAFRNAAIEGGLVCELTNTLYGAGSFESAEFVMGAYLQRLGNPTFSAIVAMNDLMAMGVLSACRIHGLQVPERLAVVGCEGILLSSQTSPPLTTLVYPREQLGELGTSQFIRRLQKLTSTLIPALQTVFEVRESG